MMKKAIVAAPACLVAALVISPANSSASAESGWLNGQHLLSPKLTASEWHKTQTRVENEYRACLHKAGFSDSAVGQLSQPAAAAVSSATVDMAAAQRSSQMSEVDFANTWGFGVLTAQPELANNTAQHRGSSSSKTSNNDAATTSLANDYRVARCQEKSARQVAHLGLSVDGTLQKSIKAQKAYAYDPRTAAFYRPWSRCMVKAGFDYPSPMAAYLTFHAAAASRLSNPGRELSITAEDEKRAAVAVASCGKSVRDFREPELAHVWRDTVRAARLG